MADFETEEIVFRDVPGGQLLGKLYRPRGEGPFPLLVDVHGGAWTSGDRNNNAVVHEALAAEGIGVFAIDFRMPPHARYPVAAEDVNFGIRWTKQHAARLGSRPDWVGGIGTSSGGHLLALSALRPDDEAWSAADASPALPGADLPYVVLGWPILDPLARLRMAKAKNMANLVKAHAEFWPDEAAMAYANPDAIVERGACQRMPRMLVLQGTKDANVEPSRAGLFADRYRAAGGEIALHMFEGEPHAFMLNNPAPGFALAAQLITGFVLAATKPG